MKRNKEDIVIDTIHELKRAVTETTDNIQNASDKNNGEYLIDQAEEELQKLLYKTREIYADLTKSNLEERETKELIASKKENIQERM